MPPKLSNQDYQIRLKRGTASKLTSSEDTYGLQGEPFYATDTKQLYIHDGTEYVPIRVAAMGSNGTMLLTAETDGGDFNLYHAESGTKTLALYGAGGNTLNFNLLDGSLIVSQSHTPSSASDTGTAGTIAWDSDYIYICTATDTWKRVAIATW